MRANTAPLVRAFLCRCGDQHPSIALLQGVPVLRCPAIPDDALHFVQMKAGRYGEIVTLLLTGLGAEPK